MPRQRDVGVLAGEIGFHDGSAEHSYSQTSHGRAMPSMPGFAQRAMQTQHGQTLRENSYGPALVRSEDEEG